MACPCELLFDGIAPKAAQMLFDQAVAQVQAIEHKYSRYRQGNLCHRINQSQGQPVALDEETVRLLRFADACYRLSDGLFDLTSGVLRRAWHFDGSDRLPEAATINALLPFVGWDKVRFDEKTVCLPRGMELDFGGIGKEYAVDRVIQWMATHAGDGAVLVNLGGDIAVTGPRVGGQPWQVGIRQGGSLGPTLTLAGGALATSGDTERFLLKEGVRYSHLIHPKTGWATRGGPGQITVAGKSCLQAGLLSTLALLHGREAEAFIQAQAVPYWLSPTTDSA
ncbi:FAD:protein FMN transferase [Ferrimonas balearica]|nr:FAD:protein FMN transferase [Ferrimonas balearica]